MKIIKYNKKLQEFNNISLYTYILNFIKNKFDINWLENNIDKSFLFILKEFKINSLDKKVFIKIITELAKEKIAFNIDKSLYYYGINTIKKIDFNSINTNIIELDLSSSDFLEDNFKNYENKRIKIPGGKFPNLRLLSVDSNCIIPVSMLISLTESVLRPNNIHKVLFFNDLHKTEIELQNLEKIIIKESYTYYYKKIEEQFNEKEYKIKFKCPNLQVLIIDFLTVKASEYDLSFLYEYFNFELLNKIFTEKENNKAHSDEVFHFIKTNILDYNFGKKLKYFSLQINLYKEGIRDYNSSFIMKKYKNGLKHYWFSITGENDMFKWDIYKEEQEEKENNNRILKRYKNYSSEDYYKQGINIDNLTGILINKVKPDNKLKELFLICENNYKMQEISLQLNGDINYENNFLKNISCFRIIKKIILFFNYDIDPEILIQLFKDISKLNFVETIGIKYCGELSKNQKNIIKSLIKNIKISKIDNYYYRITKNFEVEDFRGSDEDKFYYYFDWDYYY